MTNLIKPNHRLGILLSFSGYSAWVVSDTFIKLAGSSLSIIQILNVETFVGLIFLVLAAQMKGGLRQLRTQRPFYQLLCAVLILGQALGSIGGVIYLSLADFYTIVFTSPLIVAIIGHFFLKEKTHWTIWLATFFGFIGVLIAVRFSGVTGHPLSAKGVAVTCLASLALSLTIVAVRAAPGENSYALSFWPRLIGLVVSFAFLMWQAQQAPWPVNGLLYAVLAGAMSGLGALLTNASLRFAPMSVVSPYHYTQIIGGVIAGYLIWHHVPTLPVVCGALIITASGIFILKRQHNEATVSVLPPA